MLGGRYLALGGVVAPAEEYTGSCSTRTSHSHDLLVEQLQHGEDFLQGQ